MAKTVSFEEILADEPIEIQEEVAVRAEELRKEITLRKLREALGQTQTGLAKKTGLTQAQVSRVEAGADHKISTIGKVVSGLGGRLRMVAEMPDGNYSIALKGSGIEIRAPAQPLARGPAGAGARHPSSSLSKRDGSPRKAAKR